MELITRLSRSFIRSFLSGAARIEYDARFLVQKLAREEASVRATRVARLNGEQGECLARLDRRARNARLFRDIAQVALRRSLGLPDHPTQAELSDWGIAPVPPVQGKKPDVVLFDEAAL